MRREHNPGGIAQTGRKRRERLSDMPCVGVDESRVRVPPWQVGDVRCGASTFAHCGEGLGDVRLVLSAAGVAVVGGQRYGQGLTDTGFSHLDEGVL